MIRIKLPYGRITADQLVRIADLSDTYATGNLHATTRQDIQLHFVKLADSPQLWAELEDAGITLKEACGNTVRNVTGSARAGIDPNEPFDISPTLTRSSIISCATPFVRIWAESSRFPCRPASRIPPMGSCTTLAWCPGFRTAGAGLR